MNDLNSFGFADVTQIESSYLSVLVHRDPVLQMTRRKRGMSPGPAIILRVPTALAEAPVSVFLSLNACPLDVKALIPQKIRSIETANKAI